MTNRNLRFIFVQLLFSLAIGQVAIKISDLIISDYVVGYGYVYAHLFLCVIILSTSWVGFQISKFTDNNLTSVFSVPFFTLLLDILLVITYFIIVRGAEVGNYVEKGKVVILGPNIHNETFWSFIIFLIYFIWDLVTKLLKPKFVVQKDGSYIKTYPFKNEEFNKRAWTTLGCLIVSLVIYVAGMHCPVTERNAIIFDVMLASLFFAFRGFKQELKETYKLPKNLIEISEEETTNSVKILDKKFGTKHFIIKRVPVIVIVLLFVLLYFCN